MAQLQIVCKVFFPQYGAVVIACNVTHINDSIIVMKKCSKVNCCTTVYYKIRF